MENVNFTTWTTWKSVLTGFDLSQVKVINEVKVTQVHSVKVISWKMLIWLPGHQFNLV